MPFGAFILIVVMRDINYYKHLDKDDKVSFSIEETVKDVDGINYGSQRFLSELVILREKSENMKYEVFKKHTQELRLMLENGWY